MRDTRDDFLDSARRLIAVRLCPTKPFWLPPYVHLAALMFLTAPLHAHEDAAHLDAGTVLRWWTIDPFVLATMVFSVVLYWRGGKKLARGSAGLRWWETTCFVIGWIAVAIALLSPLDRLSDILFSAHMTQHTLLILVAAPLLVLARPLVVMMRGLDETSRAATQKLLGGGTVGGALRTATHPLVALLVHAAVLWLWHVPFFFEAALKNEAVHAAQHLMFFGTAAVFWWALVHGRYGRLGYGVSVLFVFLTAMHSGLLGVLFTVGRRVFYPLYESRAEAWGVSPLEDQQLAGLIMWIPSGIIFTILGVALFAAWLGASERRARNAG